MKKIVSLLVTMVFTFSLCASAFAASIEERSADALNKLGIFRGNGVSYALGDPLYRTEGIALLVRLLGAENEANTGKYSHSFTDQIPSWAENVVAYASAKGLVIGVGGNQFGNGTMDKKQALTLALRSLGYTSTSDGGDFKFAEVESFAETCGFDVGSFGNAGFDRGDAVRIFWQAVNAKMKGQTYTLGESLAKQGVYTEKQLSDAIAAFNSGASSSGNSGSSGGSGGSGGSGSSGGSGGSGGSGSGNAGKMTLEQYNALSADEQMEYYLSYSDPTDFFAWLHEAQEEYRNTQETIVIENGGVIDLEELIKNIS